MASFRKAAVEVVRIDVLWMYFQVGGNRNGCRSKTEFIVYVIINFFH